MKTVKQLLEFLPNDIKEKALKNAENEGILNYRALTLSDAINTFNWARTPEGDGYWSTFYNRFKELEEKELIFCESDITYEKV